MNYYIDRHLATGVSVDSLLIYRQLLIDTDTWIEKSKREHIALFSIHKTKHPQGYGILISIFHIVDAPGIGNKGTLRVTL